MLLLVLLLHLPDLTCFIGRLQAQELFDHQAHVRKQTDERVALKGRAQSQDHHGAGGELPLAVFLSLIHI